MTATFLRTTEHLFFQQMGRYSEPKSLVKIDPTEKSQKLRNHLAVAARTVVSSKGRNERFRWFGTQPPAGANEAQNNTLQGLSAMAAYIKFDGVDGECLDAQHAKWIDLESMTQTIHKPGSGETGTARRRGTVMLEDIQCTKLLDKSSTVLAEAVCNGKVFPKVELHFTTSTTGDSRQPYLAYELKDVLITSHSIVCSGQSKPSESFSLNFEEIKVTYTEMDEKGGKKGKAEYAWNVPKGQKA